MGKKDLSITSPTSSPDRIGSLEEGMQQSGKNLLLPRCLTAGETKSPMPLPGVQLTYGMSEMWGHTLRARGAEPRLHLAIPGGKCKQRCL